jgi:phage recombination protein Bet
MSNNTTKELATTTPRKSLLASMASKYSMEPAAFKETIKATVMPPGKRDVSNEQLAAFLLVADRYDLNPLAREIHAFPTKSGGIAPFVGIDGWINLANRRPEYDGIDFEYHHDERGNLESVTALVWRKDRSRPTRVTEFMAECRRGTDPWQSHPRRMLRHKATIQGLRYAFGFSGLHDEEEAMEIAVQSSVVSEDKQTPATRKLLNSVHENEAQRSNNNGGGSSEPEPEAVYQGEFIPGNQQEPEQNEDFEQEEGEQEDSAPLGANLSKHWPRQREDGTLVDARGVPWIKDVHSSGQTCTQQGVWRRRGGVSAEEMEKREKVLQEKIDSAASKQEEPPEPPPQQEENNDRPAPQKTALELYRDAVIMAFRDRNWSRVKEIEQEASQKLRENEMLHLHDIIQDLKAEARGQA